MSADVRQLIPDGANTLLRGGPKPPDNDAMEARLTAVEQSIIRIDTILPTLATKADVERGISETQRWMIATIIGLFFGFSGLFLTVSNSLKPAATSQTPAIIINVPSASPAASR
jgi:hypothetical protein